MRSIIARLPRGRPDPGLPQTRRQRHSTVPQVRAHPTASHLYNKHTHSQNTLSPHMLAYLHIPDLPLPPVRHAKRSLPKHTRTTTFLEHTRAPKGTHLVNQPVDFKVALTGRIVFFEGRGGHTMYFTCTSCVCVCVCAQMRMRGCAGVRVECASACGSA